MIVLCMQVKNTTVHGLFWGSYMQHNPSVLRSSMDDVMTWFAKGQLKPHVSHTFSIDEAHLVCVALIMDCSNSRQSKAACGRPS